MVSGSCKEETTFGSDSRLNLALVLNATEALFAKAKRLEGVKSLREARESAK